MSVPTYIPTVDAQQAATSPPPGYLLELERIAPGLWAFAARLQRAGASWYDSVREAMPIMTLTNPQADEITALLDDARAGKPAPVTLDTTTVVGDASAGDDGIPWGPIALALAVGAALFS